MVDPIRLTSLLTRSSRTYRCLFLCGEKEFSASEGSGGIPLFLGADVLAGSRVSPNHFSRTHARYAARGSASKVSLGMKLEGINSTDALWFYTVRGVFQATFEFHDFDVQEDIMQSLKTVWDSHGSKNPLAAEMHLSLAASLPTLSDSAEALCLEQQRSSTLIASLSGLAELLRETADGVTHYKHIAAPQFLDNLRTFLSYAASAAERKCDQQGYIDQTTAAMWLENAVAVWHKISNGDRKVPNEPRDTCSLAAQRETQRVLTAACEVVGEQLAGLQCIVADRAEQFKKAYLHSIDSLPPARILVDQLFPECMTRLLLAWMQGSASAATDSLIARLPQKPLRANSDMHVSGDVPLRRSQVGDHALVAPVTSLTAAELGAAEKSPKSVKRMKLSLETGALMPSSEADRPMPSSEPPPETGRLLLSPETRRLKPAPEADRLYPFIQLILEFATNCLVSGVAHVLYSRLLQIA